nr:MAG TPA: hypothetical protein [Caudoviricetes sp.]
MEGLFCLPLKQTFFILSVITAIIIKFWYK